MLVSKEAWARMFSRGDDTEDCTTPSRSKLAEAPPVAVYRLTAFYRGELTMDGLVQVEHGRVTYSQSSLVSLLGKSIEEVRAFTEKRHGSTELANSPLLALPKGT
jgi:hypothetical protein